jgi:hypothetical protein
MALAGATRAADSMAAAAANRRRLSSAEEGRAPTPNLRWALLFPAHGLAGMEESKTVWVLIGLLIDSNI